MPSENGWEPAWIGDDKLEWIDVPGVKVRLRLMRGKPATIMKAFAADYNAYIEPLRDHDSGGYRSSDSVKTSNHLNGTAMDLNHTTHPFHAKNTFNAEQQRTIKELLDWYEGRIFWGGNWRYPIDEMHWQMGYKSWNDPATEDFIRRKIRSDGFSTFRRAAAVVAPTIPVASVSAVGERVLTYNRDIVAQETGYWCGPAAAQIALSAKGVHVAESELARVIGTHTGGTDHIGLIEQRAFDKYMPQGDYASELLPLDPPTPQQRETFWNHLRAAIDSGYGVVMNWVSPASNPPIGIKGSQSPSGYGRYTIYHYVAAMGYDDVVRAVWIADPGFRPHGYWVSLEQCVVLMAPKGYTYPRATASRPPEINVPAPDLGLSVLIEAMGNSVPRDRYAALLPSVSACLKECECNNVNRIAMWFSQIGHESAGLKYMEEIADGSAYEGRLDLGNTVPGDGRRFKGRGPIQVTGRHNYTNLSRWAHGKGLVPSPTYFVDSPQQLASDKYGFIGVTWYWVTQRKMNEAADARDLERATRYVNGGLNGLADRRKRYDKAINMGDRLFAVTQATTTGGSEDMAQVPQDQWDRVFREQTQQHPSTSGYRTPGEGKIGTWCGIDRNVDAMTHQMFVEWQATMFGDIESIYRIIRVAAGRGAETNPEFVRHALNVLKRVPKDALTDTLNRIELADPDLLNALIAQGVSA